VFHVKPSGAGALAFLDDALAEARRANLLRERAVGPADPRSFASNDYLGLSTRRPQSRGPASAGSDEAGAGASRLLGGDRPAHAALEEAAAALVGQPAALAFSSGYAANVGVLSALARAGDLVVSDALNHASIIDGARLSRAEVAVVSHCDVDAVAAALRRRRPESRAFVVTESYFSMDADSPDLPALRTVCDAEGAALVVDEAHALGVLGPEGRGLCAAKGVTPDVLVGTFGKAFGAAGAFVSGSDALAAWLWNRARSFVFSTGMSPLVAGAALEAIRCSLAEPQRRERVTAAARQLRHGLASAGLEVRGYGHIVPWVLGDARRALWWAEELQSRGVVARAVRPPSVPPGTARLRLTVTAHHEGADIERLVACVRDAQSRAP
jgi:8-amino-7-oxononanoate synthase